MNLLMAAWSLASFSRWARCKFICDTSRNTANNKITACDERPTIEMQNRLELTLQHIDAHGGEYVKRNRIVGSSSQANCLMRNTAMDDSIGGS